EYRNRRTSIALALFGRGYSPHSLSDHIWNYLADTSEKIACLLQLLSPVGASFTRISAVIGVVPTGPLTWQDVSDGFHREDILKTTVADWTRDMYVNMLILMKAKGKTPTPSDESTASRNQANFKKKLLERDGVFSVVGGVMEDSEITLSTPQPPHGSETLTAAHIIPFSASSRSRLRYLLSIFAGQDREYMETLLTEHINDPSNGLLLDSPSHKAFDKYRFGIQYHDKQYRIRILVRANLLPQTILHHNDGDELLFGQGPLNHALPAALFCNVRLAIGHVLHESGSARAIDEILEDEKKFNDGDLEGDHWYRVSAAYLERELRDLPMIEKGIRLQDDEIDADDCEQHIQTASLHFIST
ncbi:uncharacterized protein V1513DRAFT_446356, partial [Lipomyces chichibuensis]|uniref:uncharacterized protein n=1 Tax=Lipomyces chichibuensis TaxID=1546026 RepID=UPI00334335AA